MHRRRNPALSLTGGSNMAKAVVGGLAGVAITKIVPGFLPQGLISSPILKVAVSGGVAYLSYMLGKKVGLKEETASAVLFGGLMQTGSVAIASFFSGIPVVNRLALGDLVPGRFTLPENPLRLPPPPPTNARVTTSGIQRAFGYSY